MALSYPIACPKENHSNVQNTIFQTAKISSKQNLVTSNREWQNLLIAADGVGE